METEKLKLIGHVLRNGRDWVYCYSDGSEAYVSEDVTELKGPTFCNSWRLISRRLKERAELLTALEGLKNTTCWCECGIGNPMMAGKHSVACLAAGAAIAKAKAVQ